MENNEKLAHIRHTLAHLLAQAVLDKYDGVKLTLGPSVDNGFYYDADVAGKITDADLEKIESKMRELLKTWTTFEKQSSLHYTALRLSSISSLDKVSFYQNYDKNISASALWTQNHWNSRTHDGKTTLYWSAQAYLINKKVIKPFVDDVVEVSKDGSLSFKIVNSFFARSCKRTKAFPCILSNCLFADSYIYAGGGPTYVSHIPLFTGAAVGLASDMHQTHVETHKKGFDEIERIVQKVRHGTYALDMAEQDVASLKDKDNEDDFFIPSYIVNAGQCIPIAD